MEEKKIVKISKEIHLINQNHFLSLRKKMKNKEYFEKKCYLLKNIENINNINKINIDIKDIESKITKEKFYISYKNSNETIQKLGYLLQMITTNENNIKIYGLYRINQFLFNINKTEFKSQKLKDEFNENMFNYLFEIIEKKYKENNNIILLLTLIISNLCQYDNQYFIWLIKSLHKIINIIQILNDNNNQNYNINNLFIIINNIFLFENLEAYKNDLEIIGKNFLHIIINSIYNINRLLVMNLLYFIKT